MSDKYELDPEDPDGARPVADALAESLPPILPAEPRRSALRERLLARVLASREEGRGLIHVPLDEGEWQTLLPGVKMKRLSEDQRAVLLELAPGAALPVHRHHEDEECVVLRGEARLGDIAVGEGDYHLAPPGSRHGVVRSDTGALLYLRGTPIGHTPEVLRDLVSAWLPGQGQAPLTIRAGEGAWSNFAAGVQAKLLRQDAESRSMLLRIAPGASVAPHDHPVDEECLVLEGEAFIGGRSMLPGDYQVAPRGTPHGTLHSDGGALLFVRGAAG